MARFQPIRPSSAAPGEASTEVPAGRGPVLEGLPRAEIFPVSLGCVGSPKDLAALGWGHHGLTRTCFLSQHRLWSRCRRGGDRHAATHTGPSSGEQGFAWSEPPFLQSLPTDAQEGQGHKGAWGRSHSLGKTRPNAVNQPRSPGAHSAVRSPASLCIRHPGMRLLLQRCCIRAACLLGFWL